MPGLNIQMPIRYVSHPEVVIDPARPIPSWHLSDLGVARMRRFADTLSPPAAIWASSECKAIEAAGLLAARHGLGLQVHAGLDENDRSSTGYLVPAEFGLAADAFFAQPERSHQGWERAIDAQARTLAAWTAILATTPATTPGDVVIFGHGGTGTLLLCALAGWPIDRRHDVRRQGCHWLFDRTAGLRHAWQPLEQL